MHDRMLKHVKPPRLSVAAGLKWVILLKEWEFKQGTFVCRHWSSSILKCPCSMAVFWINPFCLDGQSKTLLVKIVHKSNCHALNQCNIKWYAGGVSNFCVIKGPRNTKIMTCGHCGWSNSFVGDETNMSTSTLILQRWTPTNTWTRNCPMIPVLSTTKN